MKRLALASALALFAVSASAVSLVATPNVGSISVNPGSSFDPPPIAGFSAVSGFIGSLSVVGGAANVVYTFLGKEAGFSNSFFDTGGSPGIVLDSAGSGKITGNKLELTLSREKVSYVMSSKDELQGTYQRPGEREIRAVMRRVRE